MPRWKVELRDEEAGFELRRVYERVVLYGTTTGLQERFLLYDTQTKEVCGGPWDRATALDEYERARRDVRHDLGLPRATFLEEPRPSGGPNAGGKGPPSTSTERMRRLKAREAAALAAIPKGQARRVRSRRNSALHKTAECSTTEGTDPQEDA